MRGNGNNEGDAVRLLNWEFSTLKEGGGGGVGCRQASNNEKGEMANLVSSPPSHIT